MKLSVLAILVIIFLNAIFGMPHAVMPTEPDGSMTMTNCPLMTGQAVVCNMNPLEHIAAWQRMFATTLPQNSLDIFALLLVALALTLVWTRFLLPKREHESQPVFSIIAGREKYLPPPLFQELFSNGILNPKLF